jgi:hypothetical protein
MKTFFVVVLTLASATANARMLSLTTDCTVPAGFTPSIAAPFELDWCRPTDGDDITQLLVQIASRWTAGFFVRAPSSSMSLVSNSIDWSTTSVKNFNFMESTGTSTLKLIHPAAPTDFRRMWRFTNVRRAVIGGPGLKVTFVGTHPGLGTGDNSQAGLISFHTNDGSSPELADIRANFSNTHSFGLHFTGGASGGDGEATINRFQRVNVAGQFLNSGVVVNSGVQDVWFDPDRLHVMDPFNRLHGWDGKVAATRPDGIKVGCNDTKRYQYRSGAAAYAQYVRRVSGGVTFEYGTPVGFIFVAKYIGDGPAQPYRVRIKDYGFSGPTELTGLPAGVMVKKAIDSPVMKHDPLPEYGHTAADFRFIRFEQLPASYGNGLQSEPIASGCAPGNATDNNYHGGTPYVWRPEASRDGVASQYVTAYVDVTIDGITEWTGMGNTRTYFQASGSGADISPGPSTPDRTYGHILRATAGTKVPGFTTLLDSSTLTGPGSWFSPTIVPVATDQGTKINPNDNQILNTNVHGFVDIGANAARTRITNVNFSGSPRNIVRIGSNSDLVIDKICAPPGSTIQGTGAVTYRSSRIALPFTIASANDCTLADDPTPAPPTNVTVE